MEKVEIKSVGHFISTMEAMLQFMHKLLAEEHHMPSAPKDETEKLKELTELRLLAKSSVWPEAINPELLTQTEDEKLHRGARIIHDLAHTDLIDKKVLDIGCGEGHTSFVAANLYGARLVVGYDIEDKKWNFTETENLVLTSSWSDVESYKLYDVILIHDVIDHTSDFDKTLEKLSLLKSETCKIFVRCHPWLSRHGTHNDLNKAFLHLVFTDEELYAMGVKSTIAHKLLDPLESYRKLFKNAGFTILSEKETRRDVEMFFTHNPNIRRRIKEKFQKSTKPEFANGDEFPRDLLELEFVDFVLI